MSVKIRLSRVGRKKQPFYKVVVSDVRAPRDGAFIERIGSYSPLLSKEDSRRFIYDSDKLLKWLKLGAIPTDPIIKLLGRNNRDGDLTVILKSRFKI